MNQRDYHSPSFSPNGCGCLVLSILLTPVIGVLVFSSFFWCNANGARQSEGRHYVGSMNRAQQAYFAENNALATSINALEIGIKTETNNYKYSIRATKTAAFHYAVAKAQTLNNYVGGVFLLRAKKLDPNARRDEMTTVSIFCQTEKRPFFRVKQTDQPDEPAEPIYQNGEVICGKGTTAVTK